MLRISLSMFSWRRYLRNRQPRIPSPPHVQRFLSPDHRPQRFHRLLRVRNIADGLRNGLRQAAIVHRIVLVRVQLAQLFDCVWVREPLDVAQVRPRALRRQDVLQQAGACHGQGTGSLERTPLVSALSLSRLNLPISSQESPSASAAASSSPASYDRHHQ